MDSDYALEFINKLPVEPAAASEGLESLEAPPIAFTQQQQAIAVGSHIAEFAASVPEEFRLAIANSVLLAQLAANKAIQANGSSAEWREAYRNVLLNTGWAFEKSSVGIQAIEQKGLEVHKAIIPVLTAILGPAVATAALVTSILSGLAQMDKEAPWITLFNRESRRASVSQFQISYVEAPDGKATRMTLVFFEVDATGEVTQVLFFKTSGSKATLFHSQTELRANTTMLKAIAPALENKVASHAATFIKLIEI